MKFKILLFLFFTTVLCQSQTKIIAHKSHSGSTRSFVKAYKKNLFDINQSNFGLPGNKNIIVLDTVIALNDSITILKMRESIVCFPFGTSYKDLKKSDFKIKTGTLVRHSVINKKNTVDFIKSQINRSLNFNNPIGHVVFIGFKE